MKLSSALVSLLSFASTAAWANPASAQPSASDAIVRVVDIGPGLCAVIAVPGGHGMLFDAGPPGATRCRDAVNELVPSHHLDLVVLSHSDSDHIGMVTALLGPGPHGAASANQAAIIIHPGDPRGPSVDHMRQAITYQHNNGARVYNLWEIDHPPAHGSAPTAIHPGDSFPIGAARATFVAGWSDGNATRGPGEAPLDDAARNNGLSIVIRLTYGGHSVLLTGDTIGRTQGDPDSTCAYAERIMVSRASSVTIDSDVLIGQHHGAENSTSTCFIQAVSPHFVIFSAGHEYHHPRQATVDRLLANGVSLSNIFRTDLGDDEGAPEMTQGSGRCDDPTGDDDVEVRLPVASSGQVSVAYRGQSRACAPHP